MGAVLTSARATAAATALNPSREDAAAAFQACLHRLASLEWADIPASARSRGAMVLADNLAAAFSAVAEPEVAAMRAFTMAHAESGSVSVFSPGRPRTSQRDAAALNALTMGWNELDEGYRKAVCHGGLYVLPALLACAEATGASAQDVLRALILGYETVARVARAWRFPDLKLHPHALLMPVGAAAGLGFLMRLPADQLVSAVAGATALGMAGPFNQAVQGSLIRNAWAAHGANAGLLAVQHARAGIGGLASTPFDVYVTGLGCATTDLTAFADDGEWAVESGYQKMNACCQYAHSAIEAVQALIARDPSIKGGAGVTGIRVDAHPLALRLDNRAPATTLGAKFSLPHAVAAAVVHGDGGVQSFDAASLDDPRVAGLRGLIEIVPFAEQRPAPHDRPATVTISTHAGTVSETVWSARGGPDRPFGEAEVWAKVAALCEPVAPQAAQVLQALALAAGEGALTGAGSAKSDQAAIWASEQDAFVRRQANGLSSDPATADLVGAVSDPVIGPADGLNASWANWLDALFASPALR
ncbi:MmgE/PrpD family protein [Pigmentiphaga aceris]|uniref:MmgE/PrpD family protein n=1 Tax=Pigmentiphaga aceris TaxID=1940612 RepID=A0A5C0B1X0_9BURK|nr:MmgE/PrpD family protein [Pigmentiphaga aceris]QEI06741.1 MmgE/PrpD family protein [Pigmentiphaga aceris]